MHRLCPEWSGGRGGDGEAGAGSQDGKIEIISVLVSAVFAEEIVTSSLNVSIHLFI